MQNDFPRDIFRYPLVQYIPLRMKNRIQIKHNLSTPLKNISVYNSSQENNLLTFINRFDNQLNYSIKKSELAVLLTNSSLDFIKYRKFEVLLVGKEKPGIIFLCKITKKYFYENKLLFNLYDQKTARVMARLRITLE